MTTESVWESGGEPVGRMTFRVLKFRPGTARPAVSTPRIRPVPTMDSAFFWEGAAQGELRVQQCTGCGTLRHPPGPGCPRCGADKPGHVVASGRGEVYSYVVHHHPPIPGRSLPVVVALIALQEGVRTLGELVGIDPSAVHIGLPVRLTWDRIDDDFTIPAWLPADVVELPPLTLPITPTFVVATALATRDFQDVHHDRELAVRRGGRDIFLNILTTTGLVQRFVTGWSPVRVRRIAIRLGVPCHPGDTLTLTGRFSPATGVVSVVGRVPGGAHVTGIVEVS